jgi:hypothetical protein
MGPAPRCAAATVDGSRPAMCSSRGSWGFHCERQPRLAARQAGLVSRGGRAGRGMRPAVRTAQQAPHKLHPGEHRLQPPESLHICSQLLRQVGEDGRLEHVGQRCGRSRGRPGLLLHARIEHAHMTPCWRLCPPASRRTIDCHGNVYDNAGAVQSPEHPAHFDKLQQCPSIWLCATRNAPDSSGAARHTSERAEWARCPRRRRRERSRRISFPRPWPGRSRAFAACWGSWLSVAAGPVSGCGHYSHCICVQPAPQKRSKVMRGSTSRPRPRPRRPCPRPLLPPPARQVNTAVGTAHATHVP